MLSLLQYMQISEQWSTKIMLGYTAFKGTIRVGLVAHVDTETIKEIPK